MNVSICILTYNRRERVGILINSLININYEGIEIIVVDNCSNDGTGDIIKSYGAKIRYFQTDKNIGVAARNIALENAIGKIIITLDDDIYGLTNEHIKYIVNLFNDFPSIGVINFKVIEPVSEKLCNWVHHRDPQKFCDKEFLTYEITEGAVAFRAAALRKAGLYSEDFFLSHEGPDLALRILDAGYYVGYTGKVSVAHYRSELGREEWQKYYYDTRNQIWLAARNFPVSYAIGYLFRGLLSMLFYAIRDGYLLYWLRAIRDGIRGLPNAFRSRKSLTPGALRKVQAIDSKRPSILEVVRTKIFQKGIRV